MGENSAFEKSSFLSQLVGQTQDWTKVMMGAVIDNEKSSYKVWSMLGIEMNK